MCVCTVVVVSGSGSGSNWGIHNTVRTSNPVPLPRPPPVKRLLMRFLTTFFWGLRAAIPRPPRLRCADKAINDVRERGC